MNKPYQDTTFSTTETGADPLEALARQGAKQLLQAALEAEVADSLQRQHYERGGEAQARTRAQRRVAARSGRVS